MRDSTTASARQGIIPPPQSEIAWRALRTMSFERCVLDPAMLARLMADLDTPMDEHECMIDAVSHERFVKEIESDPREREEWERFLFPSHNNEADDF
jgi:hypothetical protein